jgi:hypothetical protein
MSRNIIKLFLKQVNQSSSSFTFANRTRKLKYKKSTLFQPHIYTATRWREAAKRNLTYPKGLNLVFPNQVLY